MAKTNRFLIAALEDYEEKEALKIIPTESPDDLDDDGDEDFENEIDEDIEASNANSDTAVEEADELNDAASTIDESATALESIAQLIDYSIATKTTSVANNGLAMLAMDMALKPIGMAHALESIALEEDDADGAKNATSIGSKAKEFIKKAYAALIELLKNIGNWIKERLQRFFKTHTELVQEMKALDEQAKAKSFNVPTKPITSSSLVQALGASKGTVAANYSTYSFNLWKALKPIIKEMETTATKTFGGLGEGMNDGYKNNTMGFVTAYVSTDVAVRMVFTDDAPKEAKDIDDGVTGGLRNSLPGVTLYVETNATEVLRAAKTKEAFLPVKPHIKFGVGSVAVNVKEIAAASSAEISAIAKTIVNADKDVKIMIDISKNWERCQGIFAQSMKKAEGGKNGIDIPLLRKSTNLVSSTLVSLIGAATTAQFKASKAAVSYCKVSLQYSRAG